MASYLPLGIQQELKRLHFGWQIRRGNFQTDEPELHMLGEWIQDGDVVLDIGANVGHYTLRFSELVGRRGRVIAFEPVPVTFELLAANMAWSAHKNITLLNVAVSERVSTIGMDVPKFDTGLENYYMASISNETQQVTALCLSVDSLNLPQTIKLIKIDVEGHEFSVLNGMKNLLQRDHPILIVEGNSDEVANYLETMDYSFQKHEGSPNRVFRHAKYPRTHHRYKSEDGHKNR